MAWPSFLEQCTQDCRHGGRCHGAPNVATDTICCTGRGSRPAPLDHEVSHLVSIDELSGSPERTASASAAGSAPAASPGKRRTAAASGGGAGKLGAKLEVHPYFSRLGSGIVHKLAPADGPSVPAGKDEELMWDQVLQAFIGAMQRGVEMRVLLDDGKLLEVEASIDEALTRLVLRVKEVTRDILLEDIDRVTSGSDEAEEACVSNLSHLDDRCITLVLRSTHFLTFSFETHRHREYFETCLRALLSSNRDGASTTEENGHVHAAQKIPGARKQGGIGSAAAGGS